MASASHRQPDEQCQSAPLAGCAIDLQDSDFRVRIGAENLSRKFTPVGERYLYFIRLFDDMVVG